MSAIDMNLLLRTEMRRDMWAGGIIHGSTLYRLNGPWHNLYVPADRRWELVNIPDAETLQLVRAYSNASLYRKAIIDQDIPLDDREVMVDSLGEIRYKPAWVEFREIMLHAQEEEQWKTEMYKSFAIEGLGRLKSAEAVPDMIRLLREQPHVEFNRNYDPKKPAWDEKNRREYDQGHAMRSQLIYTFGQMKEQAAFGSVRERFEDSIHAINCAELAGLPEHAYSIALMELDYALSAMLHIVGSAAEKSLEQTLSHHNPYVRHFARRSAYLSKKFRTS